MPTFTNFDENHVSEFFHKFVEIKACALWSSTHTCTNKNFDCLPLVLVDSSRAFCRLTRVCGLRLGNTAIEIWLYI